MPFLVDMISSLGMRVDFFSKPIEDKEQIKQAREIKRGPFFEVTRRDMLAGLLASPVATKALGYNNQSADTTNELDDEVNVASLYIPYAASFVGLMAHKGLTSTASAKVKDARKGLRENHGNPKMSRRYFGRFCIKTGVTTGLIAAGAATGAGLERERRKLFQQASPTTNTSVDKPEDAPKDRIAGGAIGAYAGLVLSSRLYGKVIEADIRELLQKTVEDAHLGFKRDGLEFNGLEKPVRKFLHLCDLLPQKQKIEGKKFFLEISGKPPMALILRDDELVNLVTGEVQALKNLPSTFKLIPFDRLTNNGPLIY